jgi:hypothetical protein
LFVVEFEEAGSYQIFLGVSCFSDGFEDVVDGPWDDTSLIVVLFLICSLHGEGLSCACLPICEDGSIIPFKHALQDR